MMSKLEELIEKLCPDGVEYKRLGDFATITRGGSFQKKDFCDSGIPCIHYGQIYTRYSLFVDTALQFISAETAKKSKMAVKNDLVMAVTSENIEDVCKCVAWLGDEDIAVSGHTAIIHHNQNAKYLSYYFHSSMFFVQKRKLAHGTKVIEVTPNKLNDIKIPLPPLPVQQEIVRILDNFTELTGELKEELTAELTARKKQYEYYRDELFGRDYDEMLKRAEEKQMQIVSLEQLGSFTRGKRFVRNDIREEGTPCIHYGDLYTHYGVSAEETKYFLDENLSKKMRFAQKGDVVIVQAGENDIDIGIGVAWMGNEEVAVHDACYIFKHNINPKYVSHYLRTSIYHLQIKKYVSVGKICAINAHGLGKALIPVPSLQEQERIVAILDRFETLVNDITQGLPAEIEARRKQYEYYRDRLLTFKEVRHESI
ncbi:MAG: type restriction enzyme subunit [Clostridiales bacterium]|nr:type restriction enzyme subunit [Clostridiales bacterium]